MNQYIAKFSVPNFVFDKLTIEQAALNDAVIVTAINDEIVEGLTEFIADLGITSITGEPIQVMTWEEYLELEENSPIVFYESYNVLAEIMGSSNCIMMDSTED